MTKRSLDSSPFASSKHSTHLKAEKSNVSDSTSSKTLVPYPYAAGPSCYHG